MPFASNQEFSITQVKKTIFWTLNEDIAYYGSKYTDKPIIIKKKTRSDGSTIPPWAWWYIGHPLQGPHGIIGFSHDEICRRKLFPRKICDLIYYEMHQDLNELSAHKQWVAYRAVRFNSIIKGYK